MFMAMLIVSFIFFVMGIIGTLVGALSGYTVGFGFRDTILATIQTLGLGTDVKMWELGATLGFVGGFFTKSTKISE